MNESNFEYAGFWRRFGALMIDGVIVGAISLLLRVLSLNSMSLSFLLAILYQPFFESSVLQGTPGKALMNMRITDLQGRRISFKKAMIRYVVRIFSSLMAGLGFIIMLFTEKRQTLHDLAAQTLVIRGEVKNVNHFQAWYNQVLEVLGMVDKVPQTASAPTGASPMTVTGAPAITPADLAEIYELYQKGILTEAEYQQKREEILKKL